MSMMLNPRRETIKEIIEADTDPMNDEGGAMPRGNVCSHFQIWVKEEDHEGF